MKPIGTLEKQNIFKKSLKELSNPLTLAICGLLIALTVAFNLLTIQVTQSIFISFEFLPYAIVGYLFGPVPSMLFGLLCDVLGYFTNPMGAYFPGFTLIAIIHGFLWGCLIYNKRLEIIRISISKVVIQVVINIFLNTLCVSMLYGLNFYILLGPRIIKNILLLPVEILIIYYALNFLTKNKIIKSYSKADVTFDKKSLVYKISNIFKRKEFFYISAIIVVGSILVTVLYLTKEYIF